MFAYVSWMVSNGYHAANAYVRYEKNKHFSIVKLLAKAGETAQNIKSLI